MAKRRRYAGGEVRSSAAVEERDGKLWFHLGRGPIMEIISARFLEIFPGSERDVDIWDDIWVWEPGMAAEHYAHLGVKVSVEWFRRD